MRTKRNKLISIVITLALTLTSIGISAVKQDKIEHVQAATEVASRSTYGKGTYTASQPGYYFIEAWGAAGGGAFHNNTGNHGNGGYSSGVVIMKPGETLTYFVGEQGRVNGGRTFGGGGSANDGGASGGGASGIVWGNNSSSDIQDAIRYDSDNLLIVAGGGGGKSIYAGQSTYDDVSYVYDHVIIGNGGGQAEDWENSTSARGLYGDWGDPWATYVAEPYTTVGQPNNASGGHGGGGGGYYNGSAAGRFNYEKIESLLAGGAGGTGYIHASKVLGIEDYPRRTIGGRSIAQRFSDGQIKISYIGKYKVTVQILLNNLGSFDGSGVKAIHEIQADCGDTINFNNVTPINSNVTFTGYTVLSGPLATSGSTRNVGYQDSVVNCNYSSNGITVTGTDISASRVKYEWKDEGAGVYKVFTGVDVTSNDTTLAEWDNSCTDTILGVSGTYSNIGTSTTISSSGIYEIELKGAQGKGSNGYKNAMKYGGPGCINRSLMYLKSGDTLKTETYAGGSGKSFKGHTTGAGGAGIGLLLNDTVVMSAGGGTGAASTVYHESDEWGSSGVFTGDEYSTSSHTGANGKEFSSFAYKDSEQNDVTCSGATGGGGGGHNGSSGGGGALYTGSADSGMLKANNGASWTSSTVNDKNAGYANTVFEASKWINNSGRPTDLKIIKGSGLNKWDGSLGNMSGNYGSTSPVGTSAKYKLVGILGFTQDTSGEYDLYDKQSPFTPKATSNGGYAFDNVNANFTVTWESVEDRGSSNVFRVQSFTLADTDNVLHEALMYKIYKSGLKEYRYIVDSSASTVVTESCTNNTTSTSITVSATSGDQYIHIAAIDNAGNISGTCTIKIPGERVIKYDNNNEHRTNVYGDSISTDATGFVTAQSVMIGDTVTIKYENEYSRTGYYHQQYGGAMQQVWNTSPDGSGTRYLAGQQVAYSSIPAELTLYCIWEPIVYDVKIMTNVPNDSTNTISINESGWASNGLTVAGKSEVAGTGIGSDGLAHTGTGRGQQTDFYTQEFRYDRSGLKVSAANNIFKLKGWHAESGWYSGGSASGTASGELVAWTNPAYNLTSTYKQTQTAYPKWAKNTYTIKYSVNNTEKDIYGENIADWNTTGGASGTVPDQTCSYDTNVTLSNGSQLSKPGYVLTGWSLKSDLSGYITTVDGIVKNTASVGTNVTNVIYKKGSTLYKPNFTDQNGGTVTLYAVWEPIRYDVAYNPWHGTTHKNHNGAGCTSGTADYHADYRMKTYEQIHGEKVRYNQWFELSDNEYIRKYYVTLKNTEPWKKELRAQNGSTNSSSKWVNYEFTGWTQERQVGTSPYYEGTATDRDFENKQRVRNLTDVNDATVTLYAIWQSSTITLPNNVSGGDRWAFINWSHKSYPDNRVHGEITEEPVTYKVTKYDKVISNASGKNTDDVGYSVCKGTAYKPYKDISLYAHWWRQVTLNLDLQGGLYRDRLTKNAEGVYIPEKIISMNGVQYDYEDGYTFNIIDGHTAQVNGRYDKQTLKPIDAFGAYDSNGLNTYYRKYINPTGGGTSGANGASGGMAVDGKQYRFLGWQDASGKDVLRADGLYVPKWNLSPYNSSHDTTYHITDNETIYAVWEPVLQASVIFDSTIGVTESDSRKVVIRDGENVTYRDPKTRAMNVTAVSPSYVEAVIRPGEQGYYDIISHNEGMNIIVKFDNRITDMYNQTGRWNDELNKPIQSEESEYIEGANQKHSLNRQLNTTDEVTRKQFHIPKYLGTTESYQGNEGVTKYNVVWTFTKPSWYWQDIKGQPRETIILPGTIFIGDTNATDSPWIDPDPEPEPGPGPTGPQDDHVDSILNDIQTKIRQ